MLSGCLVTTAQTAHAEPNTGTLYVSALVNGCVHVCVWLQAAAIRFCLAAMGKSTTMFMMACIHTCTVMSYSEADIRSAVRCVKIMVILAVAVFWGFDMSGDLQR